jgi:hypothetical protein
MDQLRANTVQNDHESFQDTRIQEHKDGGAFPCKNQKKTDGKFPRVEMWYSLTHGGFL